MFVFYLLAIALSANQTITQFDDIECDPNSDLYYTCLTYKEIKVNNSNTQLILESITLSIIVVLGICYTIRKMFWSNSKELISELDAFITQRSIMTKSSRDEQADQTDTTERKETDEQKKCENSSESTQEYQLKP